MTDQFKYLVWDNYNNNQITKSRRSELKNRLDFVERKVSELQKNQQLTDSEMREQRKTGFISCKHGADVSFYDIFMKANT